MRELVALGLGLLLVMALLATMAQRLRIPTPIEPIDRLSEEQQEVTINCKLLTAALQDLNKQYSNQLDTNPLLTELKSRLENGLLANQLASSTQDHALLDTYNKALNRVNQIKRNELSRLRHHDRLDEEVIRKIEAQLDLEEERDDHPIL